MNMLDALQSLHLYVSNTCGPEPSKNLCAAMKVVEKKIVSLQRKKAWRDCESGSFPEHMLQPSHPLNRFQKDPPQYDPETRPLKPWTIP